MTASRASAMIAGLLGLAIPLVPALVARCGARAPAPATSTTTTHDQVEQDAATSAALALYRVEDLGAVTTTATTTTTRPDGTRTVRTVVREQAPARVTTSANETRLQYDHAEEQRSSEMRQTPSSPAAALPRWSLSLDTDNAIAVALHGARPQLRAGAGLRVAGPIWLHVSAAPPFLGRGELGAGVALVGERLSASLDLDNALAVALAHASPLFRVGAGLRLAGPLWVQLAGAPPLVGRGEVGAGMAVRW